MALKAAAHSGATTAPCIPKPSPTLAEEGNSPTLAEEGNYPPLHYLLSLHAAPNQLQTTPSLPNCT